MYIRCAAGHICKEDDAFCTTCGMPLQPESKTGQIENAKLALDTESQTHSVPTTRWRRCTAGHLCKEDDAFCTTCGIPMQSANAAESRCRAEPTSPGLVAQTMSVSAKVSPTRPPQAIAGSVASRESQPAALRPVSVENSAGSPITAAVITPEIALTPQPQVPAGPTATKESASALPDSDQATNISQKSEDSASRVPVKVSPKPLVVDGAATDSAQIPASERVTPLEKLRAAQRAALVMPSNTGPTAPEVHATVIGILTDNVNRRRTEMQNEYQQLRSKPITEPDWEPLESGYKRLLRVWKIIAALWLLAMLFITFSLLNHANSWLPTNQTAEVQGGSYVASRGSQRPSPESDTVMVFDITATNFGPEFAQKPWITISSPFEDRNLVFGEAVVTSGSASCSILPEDPRGPRVECVGAELPVGDSFSIRVTASVLSDATSLTPGEEIARLFPEFLTSEGLDVNEKFAIQQITTGNGDVQSRYQLIWHRTNLVDGATNTYLLHNNFDALTWDDTPDFAEPANGALLGVLGRVVDWVHSHWLPLLIASTLLSLLGLVLANHRFFKKSQVFYRQLDEDAARRQYDVERMIYCGRESIRLSNLLACLPDWTSIISNVLHHPFTQKRNKTHEVSPETVAALPASFAIAEEAQDERLPRPVLRQAAQILFDRGWASNSYSLAYQSFLRDNAEDDDPSGVAVVDQDQSSDGGLTSPRAQLRDYWVSGRASEESYDQVAGKLSAALDNQEIRRGERRVQRLGKFGNNIPIPESEFYANLIEPGETQSNVPLVRTIFSKAAAAEQKDSVERSAIWLPPSVGTTVVNRLGEHRKPRPSNGVGMRADLSAPVLPSDLTLFANAPGIIESSVIDNTEENYTDIFA